MPWMLFLPLSYLILCIFNMVTFFDRFILSMPSFLKIYQFFLSMWCVIFIGYLFSHNLHWLYLKVYRITSFSSSVLFLIDYQICLLFTAFLPARDLRSFLSAHCASWIAESSVQTSDVSRNGKQCGQSVLRRRQKFPPGRVASEHFQAKWAPPPSVRMPTSPKVSALPFDCMGHPQVPYHILFPDLQLVFIYSRDSS